MTVLVCVVEGDGEVAAVPVLLRRIAAEYQSYIDIPAPIRVKRGSFCAEGGAQYREKYLTLAASKARGAGGAGAVLVILDADDDCPAELNARLLDELRGYTLPVPLALVIAKAEFEAWFIAASSALGGPQLANDFDPESIRDAKGWVRGNLFGGRRYSPTVDQPSLAATFDWKVARQRSPSLDKFCREFSRIASIPGLAAAAG